MCTNSSYAALPEYQQFSSLCDTADIMSKGIGGFCAANPNLHGLERATIQLASGTFAILFSVRELVLTGYLLSSKILLRSMIDRISTIAWIRNNGDNGIAVWERGWLHKERPKSLSVKLECLEDFKFFEENNGTSFGNILDEEFVDILHGESHGDLQSALRNSAFAGSQIGQLAAGPNLYNSTECVAICKLASALAIQFLKEIQITVPRLMTGTVA
jgi:hypothetical protein